MDFGGSQSFGYHAGKQQADYRSTGEKMSDYGKHRSFVGKHVDYRPPTDDGGMPRKYVKSDKPGHGGHGFDTFYGDPYAEHHTYRESRDIGMGRHQKSCNKENSVYNQKRPRSMNQSLEITMEEGEILLSRWELNHFIDFNSWLQNAKCRVDST